MPPPSSENDLKRLARRRLIGAVALTLLAVSVLPLLLEDEPPPASSLAVHMAVAPQQAEPPEPEVAPALSPPAAQPAAQVEPALKSEPQAEPEPARPEPVKPEPAKAEPPKPAPQAQPAKPVATPAPQAKPAAANETFVVQLAALSDAGKAASLKARAALTGLPAYTDTVGTLTRVRVGPYTSREAAVAAAVKLAENGMTGQVLAK